MLAGMQHTRTWSDIYGSACAEFEGRAGGHVWMVAAPPELAGALAALLDNVDGKGRVVLVVHDGLTPLLAALQDGSPRGVLVVAPAALAAGPAVTVAERVVEGIGGTQYTEGGTFPAWVGADGHSGQDGECPAASAAASVGVPVVVTAPDSVQAALEAWMARTPHGR